MRFLINGADAFDVPETCLRKRASSLLTAVTACSSGDVRQLDPGAARLAGWTASTVQSAPRSLRASEQPMGGSGTITSITSVLCILQQCSWLELRDFEATIYVVQRCAAVCCTSNEC